MDSNTRIEKWSPELEAIYIGLLCLQSLKMRLNTETKLEGQSEPEWAEKNKNSEGLCKLATGGLPF